MNRHTMSQLTILVPNGQQKTLKMEIPKLFFSLTTVLGRFIIPTILR